MQGKLVADNTTRGRRGKMRQVGGRQCKAIGQQTTQHEGGAEDTLQGDGVVDDTTRGKRRQRGAIG
jgi:hypothetical protein